MTQLKQQAIGLLRRFRLLPLAERGHLYWVYFRDRPGNKAFLRQHPDFTPPPHDLMYDAYGNLSYPGYWDGGIHGARIIADLTQSYVPDAKTLLEWGCGPARILRQLQSLLPKVQLFGTDYNRRSIAWCQQKVRGITFAHNDLSPPLPFDAKFDVIYAVSVLTHLSVDQQQLWVKELRQRVNPGGCLILTTHGEGAAGRILLPHEQVRLQQEGIVVRGGVREGRRCYTAYHHPRYAREKLFAGLEICRHIPDQYAGSQDVWVLRPAV